MAHDHGQWTRRAFLGGMAAGGAGALVGLLPRGAAAKPASFSLVDTRFQTGPSALALAKRRHESFLLATDVTLNGVYSYSVGPSLGLTQVGWAPTGKGPRAIAIVAEGQYAVTANSDADDLSVISIGPGGSLAEVGRVRSGGVAPSDVAVAFDDLAVVVNRGSRTVNMLSIDRAGRTRPVGRPSLVGVQPHLIIISERGIVAVANNSSNDLSFLRAEERGDLFSVDESFPVEHSPKALAFGTFDLSLFLGTRPGPGFQDRIQKYALGPGDITHCGDLDAGVFLTDLKSSRETLFAATVSTLNQNELRAYRQLGFGLTLAGTHTLPGAPSFKRIVAAPDCGPTGQAVFAASFQAGRIDSLSYTA